jgi:predicted amidohydrolase
MDSSDHWQRVMQGHSAANLVPVIASNRIGFERLTETPTIISPLSGRLNKKY